jgi:hypothetical protein
MSIRKNERYLEEGVHPCTFPRVKNLKFFNKDKKLHKYNKKFKNTDVKPYSLQNIIQIHPRKILKRNRFSPKCQGQAFSHNAQEKIKRSEFSLERENPQK